MSDLYILVDKVLSCVIRFDNEKHNDSTQGRKVVERVLELCKRIQEMNDHEKVSDPFLFFASEFGDYAENLLLESNRNTFFEWHYREYIVDVRENLSDIMNSDPRLDCLRIARNLYDATVQRRAYHNALENAIAEFLQLDGKELPEDYPFRDFGWIAEECADKNDRNGFVEYIAAFLNENA